jgi:DNA primase
MARINRDFIQHMLERIDIVELIDMHVPLTRRGKEYVACCPFHQEKTPSFTVSPAKQFFYCFGCGEHGNAISFIMKHQNLPFSEAVEQLANSWGMEVEYDSASHQAEHNAQQYMREIMDEASRHFRKQLHSSPASVQQYLKQRGLTRDSVTRFQIGYAPEGFDTLLKSFQQKNRDLLLELGLIRCKNTRCYDYFRHRLIFPIHDFAGRTIAFGGRALGDQQPKYLNSPENALFHKGKELYGFYQAKPNIEHNRIIVVEGYMDVVMLAQHGVANVVATLGTATSVDHIHRMFKAVQTIVFCFDGDKAGANAAIKAMKTALPLLRAGKFIRFMFLPQGDDPDSFIQKHGREQFLRKLDRAYSLDEFLLVWLSRRNPGNSAESKISMIQQAKPLFLSLPEHEGYREVLIQKLGERIGMGENQILNVFQQSTPHSGSTPAPNTQTQHHIIPKALALLLSQPELINSYQHLVENIPVLRDATSIISKLSHARANYAERYDAFAQHKSIARYLSAIQSWQNILGNINLEDSQKEFNDVITTLQRLMNQRHRSKQNYDSAENINELINSKKI